MFKFDKTGAVYSNSQDEVGSVDSLELYYDFEDLPDYPDGTSIYDKHVFTDTDSWGGNTGTTISAENGFLKADFDGSTTNGASISRTITGIATGQMLVLRVKSLKAIEGISYYGGTLFNFTSPTYAVSDYEWILVVPSITYSSGSLYLYVNRAIGGANTVWFDFIYVGDGSYTSLCKDRSGNSRHGTVVKAIALPHPSGGKSLYCPGNGYVNFVSPDFTTDDDLTMMCIVEIDSDYTWDTGANNSIFLIGQTAGSIGIISGYTNNYIGGYARSQTLAVSDSFFLINRGEEYHCTMIFTDRKVSVYKNGILSGISSNQVVASENFDTTPKTICGNTVSVGTVSNPVKGRVRECRIYSRVLTSNELNQIAMLGSRNI